MHLVHLFKITHIDIKPAAAPVKRRVFFSVDSLSFRAKVEYQLSNCFFRRGTYCSVRGECIYGIWAQRKCIISQNNIHNTHCIKPRTQRYIHAIYVRCGFPAVHIVPGNIIIGLIEVSYAFRFGTLPRAYTFIGPTFFISRAPHNLPLEILSGHCRVRRQTQ